MGIHVLNPGYKTGIVAEITINATTDERYDFLQENYQLDTFDIVLTWSVECDECSDSDIAFDVYELTSNQVSTGYSDELDSDNSTYVVTAQLLFYPFDTTSNFASDICSRNNESLVVSGYEYTFYLDVNITGTHSSDGSKTVIVGDYVRSTSLTANQPPNSGECLVDPSSNGVALDTEYVFDCQDWEENSNKLTYNWLFANTGTGSSYFFSSSYESSSNFSTQLVSGTHTISNVIKDKFDLVTCYDLYVTVDTNSFKESTDASSVTEWLQDIFEEASTSSYSRRN